MKKLFILSVAIAGLSSGLGCERARMKTAGEPGLATQEKASPGLASPEQGQPTADTPAPPPPSQASNDDSMPATESAGAVPVVPEVRGVYNPDEEVSVATCQGADCAQAVISDDGKYTTDQPLRFEPRTHQLDILFVLDTSASMRDEHQAVAREITKFVAELSPDVSYRIGIMLAHGPRSKAGVRVGQLYAEAGGELVIKGNENGLAATAEERVASAKRVSEALTQRLAQLPTDRSEAQGEAGLLNLYTAFSDGVRLSEMKRAGFLGDQSALLVVTIADENDVCFDYEEATHRLGKPVVGTYDTERDRKSEQAAFQAGDVCRSVANGQRLTPEIVAQTVRDARGGDLPVIFTGIHYQEDKVPSRDDKFSRDNEPGRGYLELIAAASRIKGMNGISLDLANPDFGQSLSKIGDFSNFHMKYENSFVIPGNIDLKRLDIESVAVSIRSADGEEHGFAAGNVRLHLDFKKSKAEVIIAYEALQMAYKKKWIQEGASLVIRYAYNEAGKK
ncbi:MAG: hypothetical protein AB7N80_08620 [Bdellovibrionales bacterium]